MESIVYCCDSNSIANIQRGECEKACSAPAQILGYSLLCIHNTATVIQYMDDYIDSHLVPFLAPLGLPAPIEGRLNSGNQTPQMDRLGNKAGKTGLLGLRALFIRIAIGKSDYWHIR